MLQAAVSRQRERLADASAVQFTRNPGGLKDALLKIAGCLKARASLDADAEQVAHMLFAPGASRIFATHPPLAERIRALDPRFDVSKLPDTGAKALTLVPAFDAAELREAMLSRASGTSASAESGSVAVEAESDSAPDVVSVSVPAQPQNVSGQVGSAEYRTHRAGARVAPRASGIPARIRRIHRPRARRGTGVAVES